MECHKDDKESDENGICTNSNAPDVSNIMSEAELNLIQGSVNSDPNTDVIEHNLDTLSGELNRCDYTSDNCVSNEKTSQNFTYGSDHAMENISRLSIDYRCVKDGHCIDDSVMNNIALASKCNQECNNECYDIVLPNDNIKGTCQEPDIFQPQVTHNNNSSVCSSVSTENSLVTLDITNSVNYSENPSENRIHDSTKKVSIKNDVLADSQNSDNCDNVSVATGDKSDVKTSEDLSSIPVLVVSETDDGNLTDQVQNRNNETISSESDHIDVSDDSEIMTDEDQAAIHDAEICSKVPRHSWHVTKEVTARQLGVSNRMPAGLFRDRVSGSLHMVQRLSLMHSLDYHSGCVNALNFNRIGTLLASGSDDLNIVIWNWVKNEPALVYESGHRGNVFQARFMPFSSDCHVVSCARDGQVRLAELSLTGVCKTTKKLAQHRSPAHKLALDYNTPHIFLSCGEDGVVFEIDLREDKAHKLITVKESEKRVPLYSINNNPSNPLEFCVSGLDKYVRIYDKRKINCSESANVIKYCPHHLLDSSNRENVTCACYNYNGTEIVATYNDENIYLFNTSHSTGADYIHKYEGHRNNSTVKGVNFFGPKSEFVISGSDCGNLYFWDKKSEAVVQYLNADSTGVVNVSEPHPYAPILATSGLDNDVKIWAPISSEPSKLKGIYKVTKMNKKNRDRRTIESNDLLASQILLFLTRQNRRRHQRHRNDDASSSSDSDDDSQSNDSSNDEGSDEPRFVERTQCVPS